MATTPESQTTSVAWADNARIVAIIAVITIHVTTRSMRNEDLGSAEWMTANFYNAMCRWCVPVFVMLSGALLLDDKKTEPVAVFYRKRASRLLAPLVFYSIFYLLITYLPAVAKGQSVRLYQPVADVLVGSPFYHMWFLYMMIGLYLLTPFIRIVIRSLTPSNQVWLTAITFCMVAVTALYAAFFPSPPPLFFNQCWPYIPYFLSGYLVSKTKWNPHWLPLLVVFILFALLTNIGFSMQITGFSSGYFYGYCSLTVIPMSFSLMFLLKKMTFPCCGKKLTHPLSQLVLGIYLLHPLVICCFGVTEISTPITTPAVTIPAITIAVVLASAAIAWLISQIPYLKRTI